MWHLNYSVTAILSTSHCPLQPQLITTMYIQLQIIINRQFVVLYTCTQTLFHTQHSREMQEITTKDNTCFEPFLIRSVRCKRKHLTHLTTAVVVFLSGSGSRYTLKKLKNKGACFQRFFKRCHWRTIFGSTKNHSVKGSSKNHLFLTFL